MRSCFCIRIIFPMKKEIFLKNPEFRAEVEKATGQNKSPTLNIDGTWLPDAGVEDIAKVLGIKI